MGLINVLARMASRYRSIRGLVRTERRYRGRTGLIRRIGYWKDGFLTESAVPYRFSDRSVDRKAYLSDWDRAVHASTIDDPYGFVLDNKMAFDRFIRPIAPHMLPKLFGMIGVGGKVHLDEWRTDLDPTEWIVSLVASEGAVVVKPIDGMRGTGVLLIRSSDDGLTMNGLPCSTDDIRKSLHQAERPLIVAELLRQHPYAEAIAPFTVNTVRILMMVDPASGEPFIARAVHRFGGAGSGGMDNVSRGGLTAAVDLETGVLGGGASFSSAGTQWHDRHPDTGAQLAGAVIPGWHDAVATMLRLHGALSYIPYIGWDVLMSATGPMLIEGNRNSDMSLLQVHGPLLTDPRIRAFYRHYGVC